MQHAEIKGRELYELMPRDKVLRPHVALLGGLIAKLHVYGITIRSTVFALAFSLAGAALFLFVALCTLAFLADEHCGAAFGFYGCEIAARQ